MSLTVAEECLSAVVRTIRDLHLDGVHDDEIQPHDTPPEWNEFFPRGIAIVPLEERELPGTNQSEDYGYPFLVVRTTGGGKGRDEMTGTQQRWRDAVRKAFNNKRIGGVSGGRLWICTVDSGDYLSRRPWQDNHSLSSLIVTCWARETR